MAGKGIVIQIQGDGESARRALELVEQKLKDTGKTAKEESSSIAESMERVKSAFETVGIYLGVREAFEAIKELTLGSFELGETLQKAAQKTGLAVETLSTLHYAAAVTGTDFDGLTSAVSKMDKAIGAATAGNKPAQAFLKSLGLDAKDLADRSDGAEIGFKKFAQTLAATENPIRRVQLATGLLGKAGAEMIPMLLDVGNHWDEFTEKAKAAGVYLDGEGAKSLTEMNERLRDMQQHAIGAGLAFSEGLTPSLTALFNTISGGETVLTFLNEFGEAVGREMAFAAELVLRLGAAFDGVYAVIEGGKLTSLGRRDLAEMDQMLNKAKELHKIAFDDAPEKFGFDKKSDKPGSGAGFGGIDAPATKTKGDDGIARAAAELEEEKARAQMDAQKATTGAMLAELETQHKLFLVSDEEYYREKLRLQVESFDAEEAALTREAATLQALYAKQHADPKLHRVNGGPSAEELKTQRELLQIQERMAALTAKSQEAGSANTGQVFDANQRASLEAAQVAAALEEQTNTTITARVALLRQELALELQKVAITNGTGSAEYKQAQDVESLKEKKLELDRVDRQIISTQGDYKRAIDELNDAAAKDPRLKRAATAEINQLTKQEADALRDLVTQYDALAQVLGGDYLEKAKNLHAELDKLNRPNQKQDSQFTKDLVDGFEGLSKKIADMAIEGKSSFHQMTKAMEKDIFDLTLKITEQQLLTPWLTGVFGGNKSQLPQISLPGATRPAGLGGSAGGGGILSPVIENLLGKGGGKDKSPNVVINVTNASSQPVSATQTGSSFASDLNAHVIDIILNDAASGGALSHLFSGGTSSV